MTLALLSSTRIIKIFICFSLLCTLIQPLLYGIKGDNPLLTFNKTSSEEISSSNSGEKQSESEEEKFTNNSLYNSLPNLEYTIVFSFSDRFSSQFYLSIPTPPPNA
jgi:hypothetical protein